ncbi:MAG: hypothetical protein GX936_06015 [Clostridiales bacterium]|jgi:hypothetical protein|nr:hypothetical protein [Clostridiales bacterium]
MVFAVDFDGTLCTDNFPDIGTPRHDVIEFIKRRRACGDRIILWTCRSGRTLDEAVAWCASMGLEFDAVNDNLADNIAFHNNNSRKVSADFYIDDRNFHFDFGVDMNPLRQTG